MARVSNPICAPHATLRIRVLDRFRTCVILGSQPSFLPAKLQVPYCYRPFLVVRLFLLIGFFWDGPVLPEDEREAREVPLFFALFRAAVFLSTSLLRDFLFTGITYSLFEIGGESRGRTSASFRAATV